MGTREQHAAIWKGLTVDQLYDLEMLITPPIRRADLFRSEHQHNPLAWCGRMLFRVEEEIKAFCDHDGASDIFPTRGPFANAVGLDVPALGKYLNGKPPVQATNATAWRRCRKLFSAFLVGVPLLDWNDFNGKDPRHVVARRLSEYFFRPKSDSEEIPAFFGLECFSSGAAQRPAEVKYGILERGFTLLREGGGSIRLFVMSGGISYGMTRDDGELTELGAAVIAAVGAGIEMFLVYPDPSRIGTTEASKDLERLHAAGKRFVAEDRWPEEVMCLVSQMPAQERDSRRLAAMNRLRAVPVDPVAVEDDRASGFYATSQNEQSPVVVGGQFLCPILRFVYEEHKSGGIARKDRPRCYIARSDTDVPFAIIASDEEAERVRRWLKAFVLKS
jgi:hypothetical protein